MTVLFSVGVVGGALEGWRVLSSEFHMAHLYLQTAHQCASKLGLKNTAIGHTVYQCWPGAVRITDNFTHTVDILFPTMALGFGIQSNLVSQIM